MTSVKDVNVKQFTKHCEREHDDSSQICPNCGKGKFRDHQRNHERIRQPYLEELSNILPKDEDSEAMLAYMRATLKLHKTCLAKGTQWGDPQACGGH